MRSIFFCFCLLFSINTIFALEELPFSEEEIIIKQINDSITISGSLIWEDPSITGYPSNISISSLTNPEVSFIQKIDSLGMFERNLPYGKYAIAPVLNYHWVGEELIRINENTSRLTLDVKPNSTNKIVVSLDTIAWPKNPSKMSILKTSKGIDFKAVDDFMLERMAFFEIPGTTLSLIKDNKIIYTQTYGVSNSKTNTPVTSKTLFEAGSITKLVFAFAAMRLYERGVLNLDKPLYEYLPHDEIEDERYKLMTARHVLSHQSGMSNWPRKDKNGKFKLNFTPGARYGYSGKAFEYLKLVLESITSKSIDSILQDEVLKPLKITDMHFKGNDIIAKNGSNGHKKYVPSNIFLAKRTMVAYTLQTTSEALAKFAIALYKREGLKQQTYEEMFKVHSERADGAKWGLGVRIEDTTSGWSYGHSGSTGRGFISNLVFYDDNGLGYVVLTNCQMGGWLSLPLLNEYLILGDAETENK